MGVAIALPELMAHFQYIKHVFSTKMLDIYIKHNKIY